MILLDTNVVSEAMKPEPDPRVLAWLDDQAAETLHLSSVTVAELVFGIGALFKGSRREKLSVALDRILELFAGRVLPFDAEAARQYAVLAVKARSALAGSSPREAGLREAGRGFPTPDGYIAAIATSRGFTVASRDTAAFMAAGVMVIDPWKAAV